MNNTLIAALKAAGEIQKSILILLCYISVILISFSCQKAPEVQKSIVIDINKTYQTIDGFGVNVTPDLWQNGKLKPAFDLLIDDLGATEFRFDAYGMANWLNPDSAKADGTYSEAYLTSVYTSATFKDAWAAFRYLNSKGIEPWFNVSGRVPPQWNEPETLILANFDAYSTMVCTMLRWAREKEGLHFTKFAPFNETDFKGDREGPAIPTQNRVKALSSMLKTLEKFGFSELKLIVFGDAEFKTEYIQPIVNAPSFVSKIFAFSGHTYGAGGEGDGDGWYTEPLRAGVVRQILNSSPYHSAKVWLTEFGDLDQSGEIESEFAWRMARRLQRGLSDGASALLTWDAYDNYHKHDTAWASYGLLKTDTIKNTFFPKKRYYAMKQTFRFVKPEFQRVNISSATEKKTYYVYKEWKADLKNITMQAFVSKDKKEISIVGMNLIEGDVRLKLNFSQLKKHLTGRTLGCYVTNATHNCEQIAAKRIDEQNVDTDLYFDIPAGRTIFTITTLK